MAHGCVAPSARDTVLALKEKKDGFGVVSGDAQASDHVREHFAAQSALGGLLDDRFAGQRTHEGIWRCTMMARCTSAPWVHGGFEASRVANFQKWIEDFCHDVLQRLVFWFIPAVTLAVHPVEMGAGAEKEQRHSTGQAPISSVRAQFEEKIFRSEIEAEVDSALVDSTKNEPSARVEDDVA